MAISVKAVSRRGDSLASGWQRQVMRGVPWRAEVAVIMKNCLGRIGLMVVCLVSALAGTAVPARALDRLCDPSFEDCRQVLIDYIRAETVGIDVGFWFMEDARYSNELINRFKAGVPVRVLMDLRANSTNQFNAQRLAELRAAGIPMRQRTASGIMHYKLMLFAGQGIVEFSGANFSADAWKYTTPYVNYVDESAYFTDNPSFVHSFMTKYDDLWTNTTNYANYVNVNGALTRNYPTYPKDPQLNFPPLESYANRAVGRYKQEQQKIDVIMYRITDRRHTDAMIAAKARGVPVRIISDPQQYRDVTRLWDAWNVDRMKMAGIAIKMRAHAGLNHEKLVLLYGQGLSIFGSSNWTSPSDNSQEEHNCFCTDPTMFGWFTNMFERKWNNSTGNVENSDFVPLPPDKPVNQSPANAATGVSPTSVVLKWYGGPWAHKYDLLVGTDPNNLQPFLSDIELGPSQSATQYQTYTATNLLAGTTYYWRVVSRTMANLSRNGDLWSFTTAGTAPPPPPNGTSGPGDIVLYALDGVITGTKWSTVSDSSAGGGRRVWNMNAGASKLTTALASPASYVELTFNAVAGQAYHLWMRGRAEGNVYTNDSAFVQFSNSVTAPPSAPAFRIGTTSATEYNLEDCSGCGVAGWGWQDNGWGVGVLGPDIYFDTTGPQTLRIQSREDGLSIDQIILSPSTGNFHRTSPGAFKNDIMIYAATQGSMAGGGPPPPPPSTIPAPWVDADVGNVGTAGSATYDQATTTFTVKGAGADIWGTADALHYVYQTLTGDGSVVAKVTSVSNTAAWVKAGVMIRSSLSANAAQATMLVSSGKGLAFQRRTANGGTSTSTAGAFAAAPYWVRLDRVGATISASQSTDGTNWTLVGSDTFTMGSTVYIGLGVSSHTTSAAATATFDNVSIIASAEG
jgi:phosphatidylserine/phosphatidylglycerophosphate/cardiolipin synthase-like enzyme/regulation of enolase protein 1 (concanavalin A-like superfamily)